MMSADYQGELEMFASHQDLDAWNHAANFRFRQLLSARWSVDGADSYLSTADPTRVLQNSLLLLPRGRYQENAYYTRLGYRLDHKTVVSFRFDDTVTTMDLGGDLSGRLNRTGIAGTVTLERAFNAHHSLEGNYSYLFVHPLEAGGGIDSKVHLVNLGYTYTVNPGLIIRVVGGATRTLESSFTGAVAVDKKVGNIWLSGGFQRYLSFFGGLPPAAAPVSTVPLGAGVAPNSVYEVIGLRAWGKLTNRIGLEGNVQRALNGVTVENRGIKSIIFQLRLDYKLTDRMTAFARTEYYSQNISEFSTFPLSRNRYFAGLEFTLGRAPELSGDPHKHKPQPPDSADSERGEGRSPEGR
jgi:hypothetical protein